MALPAPLLVFQRINASMSLRSWGFLVFPGRLRLVSGLSPVTEGVCMPKAFGKARVLILDEPPPPWGGTKPPCPEVCAHPDQVSASSTSALHQRDLDIADRSRAQRTRKCTFRREHQEQVSRLVETTPHLRAPSTGGRRLFECGIHAAPVETELHSAAGEIAGGLSARPTELARLLSADRGTAAPIRCGQGRGAATPSSHPKGFGSLRGSQGDGLITAARQGHITIAELNVAARCC